MKRVSHNASNSPKSKKIKHRSLTLHSKFTILKKIKVAAVSYLNTKPLLYGIEKLPFINEIELTLEYPSIIAKQLRENTIDLGLVPVAAIPDIPNAEIISDYGIAADGHVASVSIFSKQPIEHIENVYLDYQSRTSVKLAETLLQHYWKKKVNYLQAPENYIDLIEGNTAGVIIGDRALIQNRNFAYIYDLAEYWKKLTGLPFLFAAWVANKKLPQNFIDKFNTANALGLNNLNEVIAHTPFPTYDLHTYYQKDIIYQLNEQHFEALKKFLNFIKQEVKVIH